MTHDFARLIALKRGVAHSAIFVFKRHRKEPESKQRQRIRHVITRDAFPVFRFDSRKFPVFLKARYVNDVHLTPLRRRSRGDAPYLGTHHLRDRTLFGTTARSQMHHGRFKGCLPFKRVALYHNASAASIAAIVQKISSSRSAITSAADLARSPDLLSDSVVDTILIIAVIYERTAKI